MSTNTLIKVNGLHYNYSDGTEALNNINLDINKNEFIALIGQNGAGKTTLAKCLNGLLKPTIGKVMVCDIDTSQSGVMKELVKQIGYVFQNPDHQLFNDEVEKEIAYALKNIHLSKDEIAEQVEEAAKVAGIKKEIFSTHPFFLTKGLRQRVAIASILSLRPKIIIVDEPTTGQDFKQSLEVMDFLKDLKKQGHTIIMITHEMEIVAKYAERVIVMCQGSVLLDGNINEVFSQPEVLKKSFIHPPQATRLAQSLSDLGISKDLVDIEQLTQEFLDLIG